VTVVNHEWWEPSTFVTIGEITEDEVADASAGLLRESAVVRVNRLVVEHDVALVVGPVFPHEIVVIGGQQILLSWRFRP